MFATLTALFDTLGLFLETVGNFIARDVVDVGQNYLGTAAAGPDQYSDFLDGIVVMLGTTGSGIGEVLAALGTFIATL